MKSGLLCILAGWVMILVFFPRNGSAQNKPQPRDFYEIRIYHFINQRQWGELDTYFKEALIPALHRQGISKVGVFWSVANDTAADKMVYILIPGRSVEQLVALPPKLDSDPQFTALSKPFREAPFDLAPYQRMESILLQSFPLAPAFQVPDLSGPKDDRIYELRSYESPTESLFRNKVTMFNEGGEISLFKRLNFNAVFYASVLAGAHRPNLMYLTSFNNRSDRDEHWKVFGADPEWKRLSSLPEYQHNVSKADIIFLHPAGYSEL